MKTPLEESPSSLSTHTLPPNAAHAASARPQARQSAATSTLIEFPGTARAQRPAWRKELSDRVREIQERRAREAVSDDTNGSASYPMLDAENAAQGLGLVPPLPPSQVEERHLNPIVAAALARVERARQMSPSPPPPAPAPYIPSVVTPAAVPSLINTETVEQMPKSDAHTAFTDSAQAARDFVAKTADAAAASREVQSRPTTPGGIDINSPAYLKHKQEEAARARAKMLAAKQPSAAQTRVMPPARGNATNSTEINGIHSTPNPTSVPHANTERATAAGTENAESSTRQRTEADAARSSKLAAANSADALTASHTSSATATRRVSAQVLDDAMIARLEAEESAAEAARGRKSLDDFAPFTARLAAGVIDVISVIFLASPIAAALELAYGNWSDSRTMLTMAISAIAIIFLYVTAATALAGRTWGMSLVNLRAVDVETGMIPTTSQAVRRGAGYVVSLVLFGLGLLYALLDPERRGAHDHFSGTVVVRE